MTAPVLLLAALLAASPELDEGRAASSALKYAKAIQALTPLAERAGAPAAERLEAYDLIARAHLALGHAKAAQQAYEALLQLDPMAADPRGSPKVRTAFEKAKQARFPPRFVELTRTPSGDDVLDVQVVNPWRLPLRLELWESFGGDFAAREVPLAGLRALAALKPGSKNYLRAVAPDGAVVARLGEDAPFAGPPAPAPPPATVAAVAPPPTPPSDAPRKAAPKLTPSATPTSPAPAKAPAPRSTTVRTTGLVLLGVGLAMLVAGACAVFLDTSFGDLDVRDGDALSLAYRQGNPWVIGGTAVAGVGLLSAGVGLVFMGSDWLADPRNRLNLML